MQRVKNWSMVIWNAETGLLVSFCAIAALLLAFGLIANEVRGGAIGSFDRNVMLAFRNETGNVSSPAGPAWVQEMARDITSLGSFSVLGLVVVGAVGYLMLARKPDTALLVLAAVLGGFVISHLLKLGFARARPELFPPAVRVFTMSFPSAHAALSATTYLTLGALLARASPSHGFRIYLITSAMLLTFIVGISRVYLGVHYPTDVLAGWCLGSAWALLCWIVAGLFQGRASRQA